MIRIASPSRQTTKVLEGALTLSRSREWDALGPIGIWQFRGNSLAFGLLSVGYLFIDRFGNCLIIGMKPLKSMELNSAIEMD